MKTKSLGTNFIFNFIKTSMSLLFPVITFTYASRILSVEGIGKVNFAKSFILFFSMFAQLGMAGYGAREAAKIRYDKDKLSKFTQEIMFINGISTSISYLIFLCMLGVVSSLEDYRNLLFVWSTTIFLNGLGMEWLYSALEEYQYITIRSVAFQAIALLLLPILVRDSNDTLAYAGICLFASSGSYVLNFLRSKKYICWKRYYDYDLKKHLRPIFILFGFTISVHLYTVLDMTMLGFISGDTAVGLYTAAEKVNKLVISLITSLGVVLMPRLSLYIEQKRNQEFELLSLKAYKFVFFCSIPAFIGLFLLAPEIIVLFSGKDFVNAGKTMRILTFIVMVIPISVLTNNQILLPMRQDKKILFSTCVGAVANIVCNAFFMPILGENGAAIGTVAAETVIMCICLRNAKRLFSMKVIFKGYWKYWVAALPIIPIYCWTSGVMENVFGIIVMTVVMGGGIYLVLLWSLREETMKMIVQKGKLIINRVQGGLGEG